MNLKSLKICNFKGCSYAKYDFGKNGTTVSGANGTGKTTVFDAFTWLLFGTDSLGSTKFEVRELDNKGNKVHNTIISVIALVEIDGKEVELKKEQKENWVKKRGSEEATMQGNVNSFEIDGYPKSEKEFKAYISTIVDENAFKMLTNPTYFPNMPWKDQRAILMSFVDNVSDLDLAKKLKKFAPLLSELEKAPKTDDIKAKYTKSINELKKKQVEIPIRIDEISNSKSDEDIAALNVKADEIKSSIEELTQVIDSDNEIIGNYKKHYLELMDLKFAEGELKRKYNEENTKAYKDLVMDLELKRLTIRKLDISIEDCDREIKKAESFILEMCEKLADTQKLESAVKSAEFDDKSLICPTCLQEYPSDKKAEIKANFKADKDKQIREVESRIKDIEDLIAQSKKKIKEEEKSQKNFIDDKLNLEKICKDLEEKVSVLPKEVDVSDKEDYIEILKKIKIKETEASGTDEAEKRKADNMLVLNDLKEQLSNIESRIAIAEKDKIIDIRIDELRAELKEVGVKIASLEKIVYLLEEFIKYKLDKISKDINSMFDGVDFILFRSQINGGMAETCECNVNGVPYHSLNNGHRIIAGLQIIKVLQKMNNAYLPIFVDNAESINDFNVPKMNCQLIKLKVSDDKEIKVETEV